MISHDATAKPGRIGEILATKTSRNSAAGWVSRDSAMCVVKLLMDPSNPSGRKLSHRAVALYRTAPITHSVISKLPAGYQTLLPCASVRARNASEGSRLGLPVMRLVTPPVYTPPAPSGAAAIDALSCTVVCRSQSRLPCAS